MSDSSFFLESGIFYPFNGSVGNIGGAGSTGQFTVWTAGNLVGSAGPASGALLDALTGFASTGVLNRTGAGVYSFLGINVASGLVQLTSATKLPALDGSLLTNLTSAALSGALPALNGSALTSLTAGNLIGALPAISGAALTAVPPLTGEVTTSALVATINKAITPTWIGLHEFKGGANAVLSPDDYMQNYAYGGRGNSAVLGEGAGLLSIGLQGASRTSELTLTGQVSAGLMVFGFNDKVTGTLYGNWGIYCENRRYPGASSTSGMELNITELGTSGQTDCYANAYASLIHLSAGIYLHCGGGMTAATPAYNPATGRFELPAQKAGVALAIGNNGAPFRTGIQFNWNAIDGNDGVADGSFGQAIIMPRNDAVIWQYTTGALDGDGHAVTPGLTGAYILSQVKSSDNVQRLLFLDGNQGMVLANASNAFMFEVGVSNSYVNGLFVGPSATGNPVLIEAAGSDTNIHLSLIPKGTGGVLVPSSGIYVNGVQTLYVVAGPYIVLNSPAGVGGLFIGSADPSNYYDNATHAFRNAAGTTTFTQITSTGVSVTAGTVRPGTFTVATLPAAGTAGRLAYVTDGAAALAWGVTVTDSGTAKYLVWDNGTNWTVVGK